VQADQLARDVIRVADGAEVTARQDLTFDGTFVVLAAARVTFVQVDDVADGAEVESAFRMYEAHRKPRTSRIQAISSANTWMRSPSAADPDWLYGYDAWQAALEQPAATS